MMLSIHEPPAHDYECECEECSAYWTAYQQEEDDAMDQKRNWRDYV